MAVPYIVCPICYYDAPHRGRTKVIYAGSEEHTVERYICEGPSAHTVWVTTGEVRHLGTATATSGDVYRTHAGGDKIGGGGEQYG